MINRLLLNILAVAIAVITMGYSISHYADGGCDGGLCGLAILFHGVPMLIAWLFLIAGMNLVMKQKALGVLCIGISFLFNLIVFYFFGNARSASAIVTPSAFMIVIQATLVFYFFTKQRKGEQEDPDRN